jgi:hypothetical protein
MKKSTNINKEIDSHHAIINESNENQIVNPLVKNLSGIVNLPPNFDYKKEYKKHLSNKYAN